VIGMRTLVRSGHLITMDPALGELPRGDILINAGRIDRIGTDLHDQADEIIDATGHLVLPGFVDAHRHMWQTQLRGLLADATLLDYTAFVRGIYSACYDPDDVYVGTLVGYLDALAAGTTTLIDHCHIMNSPEHADAAVRAFRDSGASGVFCFGLFPNPELGQQDSVRRILDPPARLWADARRVRAELFPSGRTERIRWGVALSELEFFPLEYSLRELAFARELGAHKISAHVGLGAMSRYTRYVERLAAAGELGDDLIMVHGWSLSDRELALMVSHGTTLAVTPETELQMGMGFPALERFAAAGGHAGLGVDIASNQSSDMFTQMRLALQATRGYRTERLARRGLFPDGVTITARDILAAATIGGANALGLADEVGSLSVGKRADLLLIRVNDLNMAPVNDAVAGVVLYANAGNVEVVITDGVVRKRGQTLVGPDVAELVGRLQDSAERVLARSSCFDRAERVRMVRQIFPVSRRASLEQRLAATIFATKAKPLHNLLIKIMLTRAR
jgi:cytosine/adenosine deaminase-related metal-dependent hydrolase